jgi:hypothetical protein
MRIFIILIIIGALSSCASNRSMVDYCPAYSKTIELATDSLGV